MSVVNEPEPTEEMRQVPPIAKHPLFKLIPLAKVEVAWPETTKLVVEAVPETDSTVVEALPRVVKPVTFIVLEKEAAPRTVSVPWVRMLPVDVVVALPPTEM